MSTESQTNRLAIRLGLDKGFNTGNIIVVLYRAGQLFSWGLRK